MTLGEAFEIINLKLKNGLTTDNCEEILMLIHSPHAFKYQFKETTQQSVP